MKDFFKKIFNVIFVIIIIYMIYSMYMYKLKTSYNRTMLYVVSILYIMIMILCFRKISKKHIKKYMFIILGIIIVTIQIICAYLFKVYPSWDFGIVYREATDFFGKVDSIDYFCKYPNNIPILIFLKIIFYTFKLLNIKQYINVGITVNILAIDLSILMVVLVVKEILGKEKAFFTLFFITLMPIIYLSVPIFYTDTLSMPFTIMILYLYLKLKKQQNTRNKIIYSILIGIITVLGMNIKVTVGIIYIAILIYEIILNKKNNFRLYTLLSLGIIIMLIILETLVFKYLFKYSDKLYNESFPVTHHIMMALDNNGTYTLKDEEFTTSFKTRKEKKKANIEEINIRLKKYDTLNKKIKFITSKEIMIWNDGTYDIPQLLNNGHINNGKIQNSIYKNNDIYVYISQMQRVSMMILLVVSSLYKDDKKEENNDAVNVISRLSILGLILFFLFWEIRSRYIINYIPIFVVTQIIGIELLDKKLKKRIKTKKEIHIIDIVKRRGEM